MDQAELILAAASMRALLFDEKPQLISFLNQHRLSFSAEAMETNLGLILLSQLLPEPTHVSDEIVLNYIDDERRSRNRLDEPTRVLIFHEGREGFASMLDGQALWVPTKQQDAKLNTGLTASSNVGPMQFLELCRRSVDLRDWGGLRIGYLKHIRIDRRNLITYVANKLGGVHYDPDRRARNLEDADQFKALAVGYDWDDQSLMHAGLVATGIACIELALIPELRQLYEELRKALANRQNRLTDLGRKAVRDPNHGLHEGD